jgi:hypothetical protein
LGISGAQKFRNSGLLQKIKLVRERAAPEYVDEREQASQIVRIFLREERRRLRKATKRGGGKMARRGAERFVRHKSRLLLKAMLQNRGVKLAKRFLLSRYKASPLLDGIDPTRKQRWRSHVKRIARKEPISVNLKNFSFVDNPQSTLDQLQAISAADCTELIATLNFEDDYCQDAGAFLVLAECWHSMSSVFVGGSMKVPIQKVMSAISLSKELGIALADVADHEDIWAFPLQRRRKAGTTSDGDALLKPQSREKVADKFCDLVNRWLNHPDIDQELTDDGRGFIKGMVGELLCNAERHSKANSIDGDWSVTGFMARRLSDDGTSHLRCHLAFLSVGRSIAETFEDAADDVKNWISGYVSQHTGCGCSRETLTTVCALQDRVTSDSKASDVRSGGTGLQEVLEFVSDLAETQNVENDARLAIVSGKSCILLRPPYLNKARVDPEEPREQWCNISNSRNNPPDSDVAFNLNKHFAGTLVSVAFTLDPVYLDSSLESDNDDYEKD